MHWKQCPLTPASSDVWCTLTCAPSDQDPGVLADGNSIWCSRGHFEKRLRALSILSIFYPLHWVIGPQSHWPVSSEVSTTLFSGNGILTWFPRVRHWLLLCIWDKSSKWMDSDSVIPCKIADTHHYKTTSQCWGNSGIGLEIPSSYVDVKGGVCGKQQKPHPWLSIGWEKVVCSLNILVKYF